MKPYKRRFVEDDLLSQQTKQGTIGKVNNSVCVSPDKTADIQTMSKQAIRLLELGKQAGVKHERERLWRIVFKKLLDWEIDEKVIMELKQEIEK